MNRLTLIHQQMSCSLLPPLSLIQNTIPISFIQFLLQSRIMMTMTESTMFATNADSETQQYNMDPPIPPSTALTHLEDFGYDPMTIAAYVAIVFSIFGIFGNSTIIKFMTSKPFSGMPHSILCLALGIVDLIFTMFNLAWFSVFLASGTTLVHADRGFCKLIIFLAAYVAKLDSALVTALTIERAIAVSRPMEITTIVTKPRVRLVVLCITGVYLLLDVEALFRYDLTLIAYGQTSFQLCKSTYFFGLTQKFFEIENILSELVITFLPMAIIIPSNMIILVKLYQQKKVRQQLGMGNTNQPGTGKMTAMIVTMTTAFVLLMAPYSIYAIIFGHNLEDPVWAALYVLTTINPCANFFLYFVSGSQFRQEVMSWVNRKFSSCRPPAPEHPRSHGQIRATGHNDTGVKTISTNKI